MSSGDNLLRNLVILAVLACFFSVGFWIYNGSKVCLTTSDVVKIDDLNKTFFDTFYLATACQNYVFCESTDCTKLEGNIYTQEERKAVCYSKNLLDLQKQFEKQLGD